MSKTKLTIAVISILFITLACQAVTNIVLPEEDSAPVYNDSSEEPNVPSNKQGCSEIYADIVDSAFIPGGDADPLEETYLVTYQVHGDQIDDPQFERVPAQFTDEQQDRSSHEIIWNYFTAIIPADEREFLTEYSITTDGKDNTLAAVAQTYDDPAEWALEVDILDIADTYNLTFTLVHEFAHLLSLNPNQVPPSIVVFNDPDNDNILQREIAACSRYFPGEGCSAQGSYINAFYETFWVDIYDEWDEINYEQDDEKYYNKLDNFYYKYQDQFLTDYAVTTPEEDFADTFAIFVFGDKPTGSTIAEKKIVFFYTYPELVNLRDYILQNVCTSFPGK